MEPSNPGVNSGTTAGTASAARSTFAAVGELIKTLRGLTSDIVDLAAAESQVALDGVRNALIFAVIGALLLAFASIMLLAFFTLLLMAIFDLSVLVAIGILIVLSVAGGGFALGQAKTRGKDLVFPATRRQLRQLT